MFIEGSDTHSQKTPDQICFNAFPVSIANFEEIPSWICLYFSFLFNPFQPTSFFLNPLNLMNFFKNTWSE